MKISLALTPRGAEKFVREEDYLKKDGIPLSAFFLHFRGRNKNDSKTIITFLIKQDKFSFEFLQINNQ